MVSMQIAALVTALAGGGETVLLDFQAPWCAPCRAMESTVEELHQAGYPVRKVNVDQERSLAKQFNVQSIPCFVLVSGGKEIGRLTGAVRRSELLDLFANAEVGPKPSGREIARAQSPDPATRGVSLPGQQARNPFSRSVAMPTSAEPSGEAAGQTPAGSRTAQDLIQASVRLSIADAKGFSYGSGTLIDARQGEALVLTCGHIFRDSQGKGEISVDLFGPNAPKKLPGRLVAYDLKNDLGLVSIRSGVPVVVAPVASKGSSIAKGDRVTTVGCSHGREATALESRVTGIGKFLGPPNIQVAGLPVQGRSGGGLFNARGEVIGVCNAADPTDDEGLFAALESIQAQLDQAGLTAVYENRSPRVEPKLAASPAREIRPLRATAAEEATRELSDVERATLAEIHKRSENAEVICIVRSLSDPRAKSEVIVLDRASAAFLKQLASDREVQEARHLTGLKVEKMR